MSNLRAGPYTLKDPDDDAAFTELKNDVTELLIRLLKGTQTSPALTTEEIQRLIDDAIASGGFLEIANNLSDLASAVTARSNLGLGTMAVQNADSVAITGGSIAGISTLEALNGVQLSFTGGSSSVGIYGDSSNMVCVVGAATTGTVFSPGNNYGRLRTTPSRAMLEMAGFAVAGEVNKLGWDTSNSLTLTSYGTLVATITGGTNWTQTGDFDITCGTSSSAYWSLIAGGTGADNATIRGQGGIIKFSVGGNETLRLTTTALVLKNGAILDATGFGCLVRGAVDITSGSITGITDLAIADGGTGASTAANARTNLGLGTVATQDSNNVSITGGSITGITDLAIADGGTGASTAANARTNLGLGTIATQDANNVSITGGSITGITDLAVADGGTGASTAGNARTNLGLGSIATQDANNVSISGGSITGITDLAVADGGTGASTASGARTNLGVVIGTDVQAYDPELAAIAGLTSAADKLPYFTGSGTASLADFTSTARSLVDDTSVSAMRTTLGLGTMATESAASYSLVSHNHTLDGLSNVTITSKATYDYLRWSGSAWENVNLGQVQYFPAYSGFLLDGGAGASAASIVALGKSGSRFLLGGTGIPVDFLLSGLVSTVTDVCARIKMVSATQVSFYDQATAASDGTEVLQWTCDSVSANRKFDFKIPVTASAAGAAVTVTGSTSGESCGLKITADNPSPNGTAWEGIYLRNSHGSSGFNGKSPQIVFQGDRNGGSYNGSGDTTWLYQNASVFQMDVHGNTLTSSTFTFSYLGAFTCTSINVNSGTGTITAGKINATNAQSTFLDVDIGAGVGGSGRGIAVSGDTTLATGGTSTLGFFGTGTTKQTVTGSRGGNAALASLLTKLANYGLITDSTSA